MTDADLGEAAWRRAWQDGRQLAAKFPLAAAESKVGDRRALIPTKIVIYVTLQSIAFTQPAASRPLSVRA
ncbi:hypothetical protein V5F34_19290 [Xanthobacter autotrophicus]|uniref:hypothetical protein n=1 Tax=Xanthobacter autotrophicus TaxID=280 RepID=UPI00372B95F2